MTLTDLTPDQIRSLEPGVEIRRMVCEAMGWKIPVTDRMLFKHMVRELGANSYWDVPHWELHVPRRFADSLFDAAYDGPTKAKIASELTVEQRAELFQPDIYTTDAAEVVAWWGNRGPENTVATETTVRGCEVRISDGKSSEYGTALSAPLAICRAVLLAARNQS